MQTLWKDVKSTNEKDRIIIIIIIIIITTIIIIIIIQYKWYGSHLYHRSAIGLCMNANQQSCLTDQQTISFYYQIISFISFSVLSNFTNIEKKLRLEHIV